MLKKIFILVISFLLSFNGLRSEILPICHPIHVSIVNMDLSENKLKFSVKLFTDDFQKIINLKYHTDYVFDKHTKMNEVEKEVSRYISEHLKLSVGNMLEDDYKLINMTFNDEAVWLFFELEMSRNVNQELNIRNTLMTDLYDDQTNLFILNHKGKDKAYRYNNSDIDYTFVLK